jgi:hypothetical protein
MKNENTFRIWMGQSPEDVLVLYLQQMCIMIDVDGTGR